MSEYFEANRDVYYETLNNISLHNDWLGWISFFLKAVQEQASVNISKASMILELYNNMKQQIADATRSQFAIYALDYIFDQPIFSSTQFYDNSGIERKNAYRILNKLKSNNIIHTIQDSSGRKPATYAFLQLLRIIN